MHVSKSKFERNSSLLKYYHLTCIGKTKQLKRSIGLGVHYCIRPAGHDRQESGPIVEPDSTFIDC